MTYQDVYDQVHAQDPDVVLGKMFGMPILKIGRKAFAGDWQGSMVFKLSGDSHSRALKLAGAELFDPGMGRPMKEWVVVPKSQSEQWPSFALAALEYVETLTK